MSVDVKICGLKDPSAVLAAVQAGARFVGFVFCPRSRHRIGAGEAAALMKLLPSAVSSVGLFVDADDAELEAALSVAPLSVLQLHGTETPGRVADVKKATGLPVIKAVGISSPSDVDKARAYEDVADFLLLDARKPSGAISGGGGVPFDWSLLRGVRFARPWLLAGGLNVSNIAEAVALTGAAILDVSSGVEDEGGHKSP
ncbi:MAG: phosphoribosylanthranilate isomerase, partial [Alphaproteobacteria bacterium]|nr:phosphoribosylanthranilate isomerase [Alphaproteobacteria bacterium]